MGRKSKAKFELKGHTLPGVNQKSETVNIKDGRSPSSAFQQKSSPNKILGAGNMIAKGVQNLFNKGGGGEEGGSKELLEGTGKTVEEVTGFKVSGDGDASGGDATTGATDTTAVTTPKVEDPVLAMKSPNKEKLKSSGRRTIVGGGIGPGSTASPHSK
tara:strand:- start:309 stop:782 length:474 start_codon:yes stop_codon:yes gene_type:complete